MRTITTQWFLELGANSYFPLRCTNSVPNTGWFTIARFRVKRPSNTKIEIHLSIYLLIHFPSRLGKGTSTRGNMGRFDIKSPFPPALPLPSYIPKTSTVPTTLPRTTPKSTLISQPLSRVSILTYISRRRCVDTVFPVLEISKKIHRKCLPRLFLTQAHQLTVSPAVGMIFPLLRYFWGYTNIPTVVLPSRISRPSWPTKLKACERPFRPPTQRLKRPFKPSRTLPNF